MERGHASAVDRFDRKISNYAERRTVGRACLERLLLHQGDSDARSLALKIYRDVRNPQRRELRNYAEELGVRIEWPDVDLNR